MKQRRRRKRIEGFSFRPIRRKIDKSKLLRSVLNWSVLVLIAAVIGYALVTFFFQTVKVFGPSMDDTLKDGEVVVVNKMAYKFSDVERFDVIAYSDVVKKEYFEIKRVIGLPGETVQIKNGDIYINGVRLEQTIYEEKILNAGIAAYEITLEDKEYFVLGDNVNNSEDSRFTNVGNIIKSEILGKVVYIYEPKEFRGKVK